MLFEVFSWSNAEYSFDTQVIYKSLGNPPRATLADEPLRLAIKNGHSECAELLLRNGADPNARYFLGSEINLISPLNVTFMEMLLRHGAHPDARDRAGLTPLMKACRHPQGYAAAKLLISYGADVNAMTSERHDFRSVLHYGVLSGNLGIVKLLIDHGANVTFPKELQKPTPLDFAILRGNVEMVKLLLDAGADVNCGSPIIGLPLHIALSEKIENRYAIVHLLLDRGADPNGITFDDRGPLLKPPLGEYFNSSSSTSSTGGSSSSLPYLEATDPDPRIIRLLLQYGARVIIKAQMMDPMGILKSLYRLPVDSEALDVVLEAAESFSLQGIKRCSLLSEDQRNVLLTAATTPQSLKHQCRIKIRHLIGDVGPFLVEKTQDLPIPDLIQNYLLYRVR